MLSSILLCPAQALLSHLRFSAIAPDFFNPSGFPKPAPLLRIQNLLDWNHSYLVKLLTRGISTKDVLGTKLDSQLGELKEAVGLGFISKIQTSVSSSFLKTGMKKSLLKKRNINPEKIS